MASHMHTWYRSLYLSSILSSSLSPTFFTSQLLRCFSQDLLTKFGCLEQWEGFAQLPAEWWPKVGAGLVDEDRMKQSKVDDELDDLDTKRSWS